MPVKRFRFFNGRPVKRMRQVIGGILLTFISNVPGRRGEQKLVTQAQWDQHGEWREVPSTSMQDLRALVRN